jgi:hypothetical protein
MIDQPISAQLALLLGDKQFSARDEVTVRVSVNRYKNYIFHMYDMTFIAHLIFEPKFIFINKNGNICVSEVEPTIGYYPASWSGPKVFKIGSLYSAKLGCNVQCPFWQSTLSEIPNYAKVKGFAYNENNPN